MAHFSISRPNLFLFFPIAISLFLFAKSYNYYFFQDDFYEILISKAGNWHDFLGLFTFMENRSSYRPIGLQLYFFLSQTFFNLNPVLYRLVTFFLFFATYFLITHVISKITSNKSTGILTATLWVTSSVHFLSISWLAAAWLIIGNFFFFLTSAFFLQYYQSKKRFDYLLSFICFLLTLGSFEFFIAWPLIFFSIFTIWYRQNIKRSFKLLSPFFFISAMYVLIRLKFASLPQIEEYRIYLGYNTIKQVFWYFLWSFNVPEEFKKQVVSHLLIFNYKFFNEYKVLLFVSFASMMAILSLGILKPILKGLKLDKPRTYSYIVICTLWFLFGILPIAIFPNHSFAMYLVLASIGVYMLIAYLTLKFSNNIILITILIVWAVSSFSTLRFYRNNFWIVESQRFAKEFSKSIKTQYPNLPNNAILLYPLEDKRHIQALLNENALKVIYKDETLRTYFDEEKLIKDIHNQQVEGEIFNFKAN